MSAEEGAGGAPADLRLLPAALAGWAAAGVAVGCGPWSVVGAAGVLGAAALAVTLPVRRRAGHASAAVTARLGRSRPAAALALVAAAAVLAVVAAHLAARASGPLPALAQDGAVVTLVGVVRSEPAAVPDPWAGPEPDGDPSGDAGAAGAGRHRVVVAAREVTGRGVTATTTGTVLVVGPVGDLAYGATVGLTGRLRPLPAGDQHVGLLTVATAAVVVTPPGPVDAAVGEVRRDLLAASDGLPPDARGLVPGAAVGDTSRVPADLEAAMRDTALTHVTAVSGGHFAVLAAAVLAASSGLPRRVRAGTVGLAMTAFVVLVHPQPSVVRAAGMGAVGVLGLLAGRPSRAVPALGATVLVLLLLDPWLARSFGFALSVLATAAIVLLAPPLARVLARRLPRWCAVALAVPVAAQAVCAPVVVLLDPAVSVYAVPANLLAAPALVPATLLGVGAAVTAPWWPAAGTVLAGAAAVPAWWIATVARTGAAAPGARLPWPEGPRGAVLLVGVTAAAWLLAALVARRPRGEPGRGRAVPLLVAAAVVAATVGLVRLPAAAAGDWRVVACDVGQGDALVVRSGPGAAVMVDVGPPGDAAGRCLAALGVHHLDLLVLSHHHADHVGGLAAVLGGRTVTRAVVSPLSEPAGTADDVLAALDRAGIPVSVATAGGSWAGGDGEGSAPLPSSGVAGEVRWTVLAPAADPWARHPGRLAGADGSTINEASVVVLLERDDVTVLALGDLEPAGQAALLAALPELPPVDVLKVAHHGSAHQSPELAAHLRPAVALVSAGEGNTYGHPAPATLDLYADVGAVVLSTHECGRVAVGGRVGGGLAVRASCRRRGVSPGRGRLGACRPPPAAP